MEGMLFNIEDLGKEDAKETLSSLRVHCDSCRLCLIHPHNRGFIHRGPLTSKIAILGEAPGDKETEQGMPLVGNSGKEFDRWCRAIGMDPSKDFFATNVIQCQPNKEEKEGRMQQQPPDKDEIKACWIPRGLRMLKALPNLEVVITIGWVAARALLGGEPTGKTHEGNWFESTALPGIGIFCMIHPAAVLREPTPEKDSRVAQCMQAFKREYLDNPKCYLLAQEVKNVRNN